MLKSLDGVDREIRTGEFVVIRGPSGSGKTTLLLAIGGMLRPSSGRIHVDGRDVYALSEAARSAFRGETIGFVFQMFHLVPYLTLLENVLLAARDRTGGRAVSLAREHLDRFGLSGRHGHRPSQLSAGERQRCAIARALLNRPRVLLADEPTGNLDPENAAAVVDCLAAYHEEGGTVVLVTHGTTADSRADRVLTLRKGRLEPGS